MNDQYFEDELDIVAYHEAGHAIMAIACGFRLTELSIDESDVSYKQPLLLTQRPVFIVNVQSSESRCRGSAVQQNSILGKRQIASRAQSKPTRKQLICELLLR